MKNAFATGLFALFLAAHLAGVAAQETERAVSKRVVVKAPLEAVWTAWTTTDGIKSFFAPDARIDARPGGPFEVHFNPYAKPGLKGADGMQVMAVQEKKLVSFTWNSPPYMPEVREQRTLVTIRLKPAGEGLTEVRLHHTGWGDGGQWDQSFDYFDKAWGRVLANLEKRFSEGPIDWAPFLKAMRAAQDAEDAKAAAKKQP
jgi:uncharacterized protein YndB with AHSA1/START domain